jgi:hypothetical protein
MMQYNPSLILNRLVVTKGVKRAYDECFHLGVNIIRGKNSSGKSTISDFIFYGLGGDLIKLKNEARLCDFVYAEVNLSGKIYTLKREVKEAGRRGMDIFAGSFEDANSAENTDWIRYPYNADTKESFYQAIFKELGIPYSKSDDKNSITMHQLLRMMYVDQMTSPDRLFKFDRFDSPAKRKAIGELLIGLSDFSLYEKRVSLQRLEASLESKVKEIKTIHKFLGGAIKTADEIDRDIQIKQGDIESLEKEIEQFPHHAESAISVDEDETLNGLADCVKDERRKQEKIKESISRTSFEINDSQLFIASLSARVVALKETQNTINALSDIAFNHCPACQEKLIKKPSGCSVCGGENHKFESDIDPTFKVRKEIEFQIAESTKLISIKQDRLGEYRVLLDQTNTRLNILEQELDALRKPLRNIDVNLIIKIKEIGSLKSQIFALNNSKEEFSRLYNLYEERGTLQERVTNLEYDIGLAEAKIEKEIEKKRSRLSELTLELIRADKHHEEIFNEGKVVRFDFSEDRVTIDDRALFSASSMVYLKNSFRLALLRASCEDASYLYPRFLLMDNIEDKGMEEERSQLFQREIVKLSEGLKTVHQIIFSTSMIDSELNNSDYCIGEFYNEQNKTLKI